MPRAAGGTSPTTLQRCAPTKSRCSVTRSVPGRRTNDIWTIAGSSSTRPTRASIGLFGGVGGIDEHPVDDDGQVDHPVGRPPTSVPMARVMREEGRRRSRPLSHRPGCPPVTVCRRRWCRGVRASICRAGAPPVPPYPATGGVTAGAAVAGVGLVDGCRILPPGAAPPPPPVSPLPPWPPAPALAVAPALVTVLLLPRPPVPPDAPPLPPGAALPP